MEKGTPHRKLSIVKALLDAGNVRLTAGAVAGGAQLGLDVSQIVEVVRGLTPKEFYKSMTTHQDHTVWQDVYHTSTNACTVYLKLTVIEDVLMGKSQR